MATKRKFDHLTPGSQATMPRFTFETVDGMRLLSASTSHKKGSADETEILRVLNTAYEVVSDQSESNVSVYAIICENKDACVLSHHMTRLAEFQVRGLARLRSVSDMVYFSEIRAKTSREKLMFATKDDGLWAHGTWRPLRMKVTENETTLSTEGDTPIVQWKDPLVDFLVGRTRDTVVLPSAVMVHNPDNAACLSRVRHIQSSAELLMVFPYQIQQKLLKATAWQDSKTYQVTAGSMESGSWPMCSDWHVMSWTREACLLVQESTGIPDGPFKIIVDFIGKWTVEVQNLLPRSLQSLYERVCAATGESEPGWILQLAVLLADAFRTTDICWSDEYTLNIRASGHHVRMAHADLDTAIVTLAISKFMLPLAKVIDLSRDMKADFAIDGRPCPPAFATAYLMAHAENVEPRE